MATNYELLSDARSFLRDQVAGVSPNSELATSWDEFFAVYDTIIRRFALAGGVPRHEVDECAQEVWTAVVVHLEGFEPDTDRGRFRTWLFSIVRSKATDLVRQKQRCAAVSLNDSRFELDVEDEPGDSPEELAQCWQNESLRVLLADLKSQVTPTSYRIFESRAVNGKRFDSLAVQFGMTPTAVRTRYHRTLKRFRAIRRRFMDLDE